MLHEDLARTLAKLLDVFLFDLCIFALAVNKLTDDAINIDAGNRTARWAGTATHVSFLIFLQIEK